MLGRPCKVGHNIVGHYMLRPFSHTVACCCDFLGVVASVYTPMQHRRKQHATLLAQHCRDLLCPFARRSLRVQRFSFNNWDWCRTTVRILWSFYLLLFLCWKESINFSVWQYREENDKHILKSKARPWKRIQHCWLTTPNIVAVTCCVRLPGFVAQSLKPVATLLGQECCELLRPFARS